MGGGTGKAVQGPVTLRIGPPHNHAAILPAIKAGFTTDHVATEQIPALIEQCEPKWLINGRRDSGCNARLNAQKPPSGVEKSETGNGGESNPFKGLPKGYSRRRGNKGDFDQGTRRRKMSEEQVVPVTVRTIFFKFGEEF